MRASGTREWQGVCGSVAEMSILCRNTGESVTRGQFSWILIWKQDFHSKKEGTRHRKY